MKKLILSLMLISNIAAVPAQTVTTINGATHKGLYTKKYSKSKTKKAEQWLATGEWKNGFTKGNPDTSVNIAEFYDQYTKNPDTWKAVFKWLESTDLETISAGKHIIKGTNLIASVEDSQNEDISKRKSESHKYNIDFMLIVDGKEGFLRLDHKTSTSATKYKYDVTRYDYKTEYAEYLQVSKNRFVIMFPDDWHVAKVMTKDGDQKLRVIVIKVPYIF